jgi:hypothetical protein
MCESHLAVPRHAFDVGITFSHDHMGYLARIPTGTFATVYPELIDNVRRAMLTYTDSIRNAHLTTSSAPTGRPGGVPGPTVPQLTISISAEGLPMLPDRLLEICDVRTEQERLVKQYLAQHYSECNCLTLPPELNLDHQKWQPVVKRIQSPTLLSQSMRPRWSQHLICHRVSKPCLNLGT